MGNLRNCSRCFLVDYITAADVICTVHGRAPKSQVAPNEPQLALTDRFLSAIYISFILTSTQNRNKKVAQKLINSFRKFCRLKYSSSSIFDEIRTKLTTKENFGKYKMSRQIFFYTIVTEKDTMCKKRESC